MTIQTSIYKSFSRAFTWNLSYICK